MSKPRLSLSALLMGLLIVSGLLAGASMVSAQDSTDQQTFPVNIRFVNAMTSLNAIDVYINGEELVESYAVHTDPPSFWRSENFGPTVIPPDSFFMMGDNRDGSYDGRYWGFLPRLNVRGRPLLVYYSFDSNTYKPLPFFTNIRWGRVFSTPE